MPCFLVESFLPAGVTGASVARACAAASEPGHATLRHLLELPDAQLCLCVVEARTAELAGALLRAGGLSVDCVPEVVSVLDVPAGAEA